MYRNYIKRIIDLVVSTSVLVILSPLLLIISLLVWIKLGTPIFFKQYRAGKNEVPFHIYKFTTMTNKKDKDGQLLPDEQRLTPFGQCLRTMSLDELPGLFNVIKGEMSLIGPRPLPVVYLSRYNEEQKRRHEVRPGITGYAQINGRNAISWDLKFKYDTWYVDNISFWVDIKIIWLTIGYVLKRKDIHAANHATMPEFKGNSNPND